MKKFLPYLFFLLLGLTACGTDYNINGTYISQNDNMDFSVVILDDFCRLDVSKTNEDGETATVAFDGTVSKENDIAVITIDKEAGINGNKFEFIYNDRKETLTATGDNSVFEKTSPESILPDGCYSAEFDGKSYELTFDGDRCSLTVISSINEGQTTVIYDKASVKADGNIITMEFEGNALGDKGVYRFISGSDILMNTENGEIFKKTLED